MDNLAIANNEYFIRLNNFDKARNTKKYGAVLDKLTLKSL
ncbi:hypothetical protein FNFX1_0742 [Francisella cf. novicida Fx1]|nr:hypothetical protein FNFX1_0742 [Francisella cf. novicida Fx1]